MTVVKVWTDFEQTGPLWTWPLSRGENDLKPVWRPREQLQWLILLMVCWLEIFYKYETIKKLSDWCSPISVLSWQLLCTMLHRNVVVNVPCVWPLTHSPGVISDTRASSRDARVSKMTLGYASCAHQPDRSPMPSNRPT